MTGYNAGSRHEKLSITPNPVEHAAMSDDYKEGYKIGVLDRKVGRLTDNEQATRFINEAWSIYQAGGIIVGA